MWWLKRHFTHTKLDEILRECEHAHRASDAIFAILQSIQRKEVVLMREVDALIAEVAETKGVDESTAVAIDSILVYIQVILDKIANTVDPVVIKAQTDQLAAFRTALAIKRDALLAAIPAVPAPPTP